CTSSLSTIESPLCMVSKHMCMHNMNKFGIHVLVTMVLMAFVVHCVNLDFKNKLNNKLYEFNCTYSLTKGEYFSNFSYGYETSRFFYYDNKTASNIIKIKGVEDVKQLKPYTGDITIGKWTKGNYSCTVGTHNKTHTILTTRFVGINSGHNIANNVFMTTGLVALSSALLFKI
ncbi:unnamed protein product, partial [Medioppia subpectinata]